VHETERELLSLFKTIDYNGDGKISKPELRAALSRAGMAVPNTNLDNFFNEVDTNNDGTISFEEWRYVYQQGCSGLCQGQVAVLDRCGILLLGEAYCKLHFHSRSCLARTHPC
jgi:hypothetical protein